METRIGIDGKPIKTFVNKDNKEVFLDKDGTEKWITSIECLNCGEKIHGTYGGISETIPLCYSCRKTYKPIKRGNQ